MKSITFVPAFVHLSLFVTFFNNEWKNDILEEILLNIIPEPIMNKNYYVNIE